MIGCIREKDDRQGFGEVTSQFCLGGTEACTQKYIHSCIGLIFCSEVVA